MTEKLKSAIKIIKYEDTDRLTDFMKMIRRSIDRRIKNRDKDENSDENEEYEIIITTKQKLIVLIDVYNENIRSWETYFISIDPEILAKPKKNVDIPKVFEREYAVPVFRDLIKIFNKEWVWIEDYFEEQKNESYLYRLRNLQYYVKLLLAIVKKSNDIITILEEFDDMKYQVFRDFAIENAFEGIFSDDVKLSTLIALLHTKISVDIDELKEMLGCDNDECLKRVLEANVDDSIISMKMKLLRLQLN